MFDIKTTNVLRGVIMKKILCYFIAIAIIFAAMLECSILSKAITYEYAIFPMTYLNISQGVNDNYSHKERNAIDITGKDGGIDSAYAPFTGVIKKIYKGYTVWLESCNPVMFADGTIDYMTIMVIHDNDTSDLYEGKVIKQGERFFEEGTAGNATGNHIHLECGRGKFEGTGWHQNSYGKWTINNSILPYDALYISSNTIVKNGYGYSWKTVVTCSSSHDKNGSYDSVGICTVCQKYQFPYNNDRNTSYAGTYKVKSGATAYIRKGPYQKCTEVTHTTSGNFTVVARVLNCKGNYWYELSYNGSTCYVVSTNLEKVTHTHSYSYGYESAHPHKQYKKCSSCGDYSYTGATQTVSSCTTCFPPSSYGSTNPDDYPIPERTLKYDSSSATMTGNDVAWVQAVLYQLGYSITIDGKYGPSTRNTIKTFQSTYGLTVDGYCGPATRAKLQELWNAKKHTHSYTQYSESAHPHKVYMKCSCGDTYYTGATSVNWTGTSYESAHPHKVYRTCSCGYTEYTGGTQNLWTGTTYETAHPHKTYNSCSCGYKEYTGDTATDKYCYTCIGDSYVDSIEYNGHKYSLYKISTPWEYAKTFCESKGGHLATITDEAEWEFVKGFIDGKVTWLGGYLTPEQNWEWVTDEAFSFTDWLPEEPNNANGNEGYLGTYVDNGWNDFPNSTETVNYFLCEYTPLEYISRTRYNNHTYDVYEKDVSWQEAINICREKGGHLVTINDAKELAFLNGVIKGNVCWTSQYLNTVKNNLYFYYGISQNTAATKSKIFICEFDPITITFDANGGENASETIEKAHEEDIVISSDIPTRNGYAFLGWSEQSDAITPTYEIGDILTENSDKILYAVWIEANANKKTGDTNGDGKINGKDYTLVLQSINGWDVTVDKDAADVNGDGKINGKDYALLLQFINGWNVTLQ